jgi:hypothetical protein
MVRRSPFRRRPGRPPVHGAHTLTRVLRTVRLDTIDRRSQVGVALRRVQEELTAQLGGPDEVSAAQALLIEQAAIKAVITQAVGEWILKQECPVNDRQRWCSTPCGGEDTVRACGGCDRVNADALEPRHDATALPWMNRVSPRHPPMRYWQELELWIGFWGGQGTRRERASTGCLLVTPHAT